MVAAIGDITRFQGPGQLVAYLGLDPKVRQSGSEPARPLGRLTDVLDVAVAAFDRARRIGGDEPEVGFEWAAFFGAVPFGRDLRCDGYLAGS